MHAPSITENCRLALFHKSATIGFNSSDFVLGKVSVNNLRGKLYLLAMLPAKDGSGGVKQMRIPLGLFDAPADHKIAEKRRALLQRQVDTNTFDWDDWTETTKGTTWKSAIDQLYRKRVVYGRTGERTWEISYMGRLRQMPMGKVVTTEEIKRALTRYERDTASYREFFYLLKDICDLISVTFPEAPVPTYGSKPPVLEVPSDKEIVEWVQKAMDYLPELGWTMGMMATYGLRDHEVPTCRFVDDKHRLWVDKSTKTGERIVVPVPREWVELFDLRNEKRRSGHSPGYTTAKWLHDRRKKIGMPFRPYSFRHGFAGRLWTTGGSKLDIYTASRLMGHSPSEHSKTYRAFLAPHTIADKAEEALFG